MTSRRCRPSRREAGQAVHHRRRGLCGQQGQNKLLAQEFVTNYWSTPEVNLALFKASPNVPALKAALEQIKASDPLVVKVADAGRRSGQIMPSIPEMAAVWDPSARPRPRSSPAPTPTPASQRQARPSRLRSSDRPAPMNSPSTA